MAAALGFDDADALMAAIAEAGRTVAWVTDDVWRRRELVGGVATRRRRRARRRPTDRDADRRSQRHRSSPSNPAWRSSMPTGRPGEARSSSAPDADLAGDPGLSLRRGGGGGRARAAHRRPPSTSWPAPHARPPDPWPDDMRSALVRVLATGPPAIPALEALDQRGLLVRLLPEWAAVRNRPQRNAYHRFTVDRHLLEAAARPPPWPAGSSRPDLLLVGALLHDIGKGFPGDHTDVGRDGRGATIGTAHGLSPRRRGRSS